MPKRVRTEAAQYLCKIPYAETRKKCEMLKSAFLARYRKDYPKAVEILLRDWDSDGSILPLSEGALRAYKDNECSGVALCNGEAKDRCSEEV
jgi:hypothetical protein